MTIMALSGDVNIEGRSTVRPPLFKGTNFSYWKNAMQIFIESTDMELWEIVNNGPYTVPKVKNDKGEMIDKPKDQYTSADWEKLTKNSRAKHILSCGLDANEYNRISACDTAKQIWNKLIVTYEGTSQVRETKMNMFIHQYELFKMQTDESIKDMFTRFTDITNNLKSLGKTYTNEEMVRKILRCLPKSKWGPKVTAIEEAQDLKKLELDDLLGKLLTHEIHLKEDDGESSKKGIALKAIQEDCTSEEEEPNGNDDEAFSLIVRGLNKMGLKKKFNQRGFNSKGPSLKRNEKFSKGKFSHKDNTNVSSCYGCGMPGHLLKDCQLIQKKGESRRFKKKDSKRAMIAAWSDSDTSESESDEEHTANICLMAKDVKNDERFEYESTDEVDISALYDCSKEELINALVSFAKLERKYLSKYKGVKKNVQDLNLKNMALEKSNNDLQAKVRNLETKNKELQAKCDEDHKIILKFTQGQENLDKLLCTQRASFNKEGI